MNDGQDAGNDGTPTHTESFEAQLGLSTGLSSTQTHRAIKWNRKAAAVVTFLVFVPPVLTWLLAPAFPPLGGFLGVVIAWAVGLIGAYVGYIAVVDHVTVTHREHD